MKTKLTEYNSGTLTRNVQLLIDESFAERTIPASDSVRLLDQIVEETDLMPLERAIKRTGRKHRTNPVTMIKILIYAAMQHNYASRGIAQSCNRGINYIWLLNGEAAPSYRSICRFRREILSECAEELFYKIVHKLKAVDEICFEHLFVDGTKLEANANKYEKRTDEKIAKATQELCRKYGILTQDTQEL